MDEAHRRMQVMRDRYFGKAPLAPMSWGFSGVVLSPDGRLSVDVDEFDEHHRRRRYTLWSEVDGTIHEMRAPVDTEEQLVLSPDPRISEGSPEPGLPVLSELASRHLGRLAADAWLDCFPRPSGLCTHSPATQSSPNSVACPRCPSTHGRSGQATGH